MLQKVGRVFLALANAGGAKKEQNDDDADGENAEVVTLLVYCESSVNQKKDMSGLNLLFLLIAFVATSFLLRFTCVLGQGLCISFVHY